MSIFSKLRASAEESRQSNAAVNYQRTEDDARRDTAKNVQMAGGLLGVYGMTSFMLIAMSNQAADLKAKFPNAEFTNDLLSRTLQSAHDSISTLGNMNLSDGSSIQNAVLVAGGAAVAGLVLMVAKDAPIFQQRLGLPAWAIELKNTIATSMKKMVNGDKVISTEKIALKRTPAEIMADSVKKAEEWANNSGFDLDELDDPVNVNKSIQTQ